MHHYDSEVYTRHDYTSHPSRDDPAEALQYMHDTSPGDCAPGIKLNIASDGQSFGFRDRLCTGAGRFSTRLVVLRLVFYRFDVSVNCCEPRTRLLGCRDYRCYCMYGLGNGDQLVSGCVVSGSESLWGIAGVDVHCRCIEM